MEFMFFVFTCDLLHFWPRSVKAASLSLTCPLSGALCSILGHEQDHQHKALPHCQSVPSRQPSHDSRTLPRVLPMCESSRHTFLSFFSSIFCHLGFFRSRLKRLIWALNEFVRFRISISRGSTTPWYLMLSVWRSSMKSSVSWTLVTSGSRSVIAASWRTYMFRWNLMRLCNHVPIPGQRQTHSRWYVCCVWCSRWQVPHHLFNSG